jgi:MFS transporter, OFA family, oxalate/formate antiporter
VELQTKPIQHSRIIAASPIYYGWIILLAGTFGMAMTTPGQTVGVSAFLDSMIADLNLSRSVVSLFYAIGTLCGSFTLPFVGQFIDRYGPRRAVVIISSLFALACVWMGSIWNSGTLLVGFILIRGLGQGALGLVSLYVVNVWFVKRRGAVLGMSGVGIALASSIFPLLIEFLITTVGWRSGYKLLGLLVACTILPIGALLYRGRPELYGLLPDSNRPINPEDTTVEQHFTLAQARSTLTFWLFAMGNLSVAALVTGLVFHHYSIMDTSGVDRPIAALMFVPFGIVMAGANLLTGILVDRVSPRLLLGVTMGLLSLALLTATRVHTTEAMLLYGSLLGFMQGMSIALQAVVYAHYFGRLHLGSINGLATTIAIAGTAFGPILFALGFDRFGSYAPVLVGAIVLPVSVILGTVSAAAE